VDLDFVEQYISGHFLCDACQDNYGGLYLKADIDKKIDEILKKEVEDESR
jgi:hypothetical protein